MDPEISPIVTILTKQYDYLLLNIKPSSIKV